MIMVMVTAMATVTVIVVIRAVMTTMLLAVLGTIVVLQPSYSLSDPYSG